MPAIENNISKKIIDQVEYDGQGMWFSEIFIFSIICEIADASKIIESGRARGISTKILCEYFKDDNIKIISIDKQDSESKDAKIAEKRLSKYDNVELRYGNSRKIIDRLMDEQTCVLIDGPKGDTAIQMAIELMEKFNSPAVAIHDLHKERFWRELSEVIFNHSIYTDNNDLVDEFEKYDERYLPYEHESISADGEFSPYVKFGNDSESYGPTLGIFFNYNNPIDKRVKNNYLSWYDKINENPKSVLSVLGEDLKRYTQSNNLLVRKLATYLLKIGRILFR